MNRFTIEQTLVAQLGGVTEPVDLCDQHGTVLGRFIPNSANIAEAGCPYSTSQLKEMRSELGGRSLPSILSTLGDR